MFGKKKLSDKVDQVGRDLDGKMIGMKGDLDRAKAELEVLRNRDEEHDREIAQLKMQIEELSKRIPIIRFKPGKPPIVEVEENE